MMQQEQAQERHENANRTHSRQSSRQSSGWIIFWSLWWMVGLLPWLVVFLWSSLLPVFFIWLFYLIVLLGYIIVPIVLRRRYKRIPMGWRIAGGLWWMLALLPGAFMFRLSFLQPVVLIVLLDLLVLIVYMLGLGFQPRQHNVPLPPLQPSSTYEQGYQEQKTRDSGNPPVEPALSTTAPSQWDDEQPQAYYQ